jgi:hypothetical protein
VLAKLARQALYQQLFQYTPKLSTLLREKTDTIFTQFLQYADEQALSLCWSLPVQLLDWLKRQGQWRSCIDLDIGKELLLSAVIQWSLRGLDHITVQGVLVASAHFPNMAMGLRKSRDISMPTKATWSYLPSHLFPLADSYAVSYEQSGWGYIEWLPLPT